MKYFLDTEFIEGFKKPLFGKRRHFIDLISIGIVAEDGREYYAVSNEFNTKDADNWVRKNVIDKIEVQLFQQQNTFAKYHFNFNLKELLKQFGKSNKQIAEEIIQFVFNKEYQNFKQDRKEFHQRTKEYGWNIKTPIEFYGYYADYDWVLFCSLFGRMIDLPKGFPMYCKDLKQTMDEKCLPIIEKIKDNKNQIINGVIKYDGFQPTLDGAIQCLKDKFDYPKQENEHNALDDAKWNFKLFKFLEKIKV